MKMVCFSSKKPWPHCASGIVKPSGIFITYIRPKLLLGKRKFQEPFFPQTPYKNCNLQSLTGLGLSLYSKTSVIIPIVCIKEGNDYQKVEGPIPARAGSYTKSHSAPNTKLAEKSVTRLRGRHCENHQEWV